MRQMPDGKRFDGFRRGGFSVNLVPVILYRLLVVSAWYREIRTQANRFRASAVKRPPGRLSTLALIWRDGIRLIEA